MHYNPSFAIEAWFYLLAHVASLDNKTSNTFIIKEILFYFRLTSYKFLQEYSNFLLHRYLTPTGDTHVVCIHYNKTNTGTKRGQKGDNLFHISDIYYFPCILINCSKWGLFCIAACSSLSPLSLMTVCALFHDRILWMGSVKRPLFRDPWHSACEKM